MLEEDQVGQGRLVPLPWCPRNLGGPRGYQTKGEITGGPELQELVPQ